MRTYMTVLGVVALCLSFPACHKVSGGKNSPAIVGTWFVKAPEAPFQYHMFISIQTGPCSKRIRTRENPNTSDSNGMGVWLPDGDRIKGKFVEVTADRTTRQFVSWGEISFSIKVNGDDFNGTASAIFYDAKGLRLRGPLPGNTGRSTGCASNWGMFIKACCHFSTYFWPNREHSPSRYS